MSEEMTLEKRNEFLHALFDFSYQDHLLTTGDRSADRVKLRNDMLVKLCSLVGISPQDIETWGHKDFERECRRLQQELRIQLAAEAMSGLVAGSNYYQMGPGDAVLIAKAAFMVADAMLEEAKK